MRLLLAMVFATAAILGSACGTAQQPADVPDGVIARIGDETLTGAELEAFLADVRTSYEARSRPFPEEGSDEYSNLLAEAIDSLVGRMQTELTASELGVSLSDSQIDAEVAGKESNGLAKYGLSIERVRADLRDQMLAHMIFMTVVRSAQVTDADVRAYYDSHLDDYTRWPPREVDYIFVRDEDLAHDLVHEIEAGADMRALAEQYGDPGVEQGRITIDFNGPGLPPFQRAAYTLLAGEIWLGQSGVGWSIMRPVSEPEPGRLISFARLAEDLRLELQGRAQKQAMDAWTEQNEAEVAALTSYKRGWDPAELRRDVTFPVPPEPQRDFAKCDLRDGEYTYERLAELGCAGDFPIPGVDGEPCPVPLVEDPLVGGFTSDEVDSGYAEYLASDEGSCVPDPRGQTVGYYHREAPPLRQPGPGFVGGSG